MPSRFPARARGKTEVDQTGALQTFRGVLIALTGGREIKGTVAKLLEVSERARERVARGDEGYARVTVESTAATVARNYGRSRA